MAKYVGWNRAEVTIAGAATDSREILTFVADDDTTVVGVHVEVLISLEPNDPSLGSEASNIAGFARLLVNRAGNTLPANVPSGVWDFQSGAPITDTLNDADAGDTWAITAMGGNSAGGANQPSHGTVIRGTLSPKTKRKLRRGDSLIVQLNLSNGGIDNAIMQYSVVGTLFTLDP